ncbi:MAG: efflux RND transporter permease subunit, partial [Bacteroidota bacterium]
AVAYPGASPLEMEEGVLIKVEESLKGLQGIEEINSTASENSARVVINVNPDYQVETVLADVKNAVDRINSFPENAEKPVVYLSKPRGDAIDIVLSGEVDLMTLKRYAEGVRYDLLASEDLSQVAIQGYPDVEISIEIKEQTLTRYGLTFDQVSAAVRLNNRDISSGSIKTDDEEIRIRSRAKQYDAKGLGQIIIRTNPDGSILRLIEVATIKEQFAEVPNKTVFNDEQAVTLKVTKLPEEDVIKVTDYVKAYVADFNASNTTVRATIQNDRSLVLQARLGILLNNGWVGLMLVLVLLGLFLNLRLSFWVAFGIPFSFLGMIILANQFGVTINIMSLFGMILVIGILVDDGIVVGENIYAHFEKGKSPLRAAVDGTMEVMGAVFTGVMTTILAFSMFFFFEGRFGQFTKEMAVVVILCLAFSLIECFFVLPPHLAHSGALSPKEPSRLRKSLNDAFIYLRDRVYGPVLAWSLRFRYVVISATFALIMTILGLMQGNYISQTFFPPISFSDNLDATVTLKPGTREDKTEAVLLRVQAAAFEVDKELRGLRGDERSIIQTTRMDIGSSGGGFRGPSLSGSHLGTLRLQLLPENQMGMPKFKFGAMIRKKLGPMPDVEQFTIGGRRAFGKAVSLSLKGRDGTELEGAKNMAKEELSKLDDLKDITDNNLPGNREINIQLKPQAYVLGLSHNDITRQIRQGFFGEEVQRLQKGQDEVRVWVRYPQEERRSLGELEEMRIRTGDGREFALGELVVYDTERGIIDISHLNGAREVRVEADLADQSTPVAPLLANLQDEFLPRLRAAYPGISVSFEGQSRRGAEFSSSLTTIWPFFAISMILLISLAFRSFSQSFLIIFMIPLGLLGAVIGHGLEGKPVSILSFYGMLALSGVIVNDAVVREVRMIGLNLD